MKRSFITLFAVATLFVLSASAKADVITFTNVTGSSGTISQQITGGTVTYTWSGAFTNNSAGSLGNFFDNQVVNGTNLVEFTFVADPGYSPLADFEILSQRGNTASAVGGAGDFGTLLTDGIFDVTAQTGVPGLSGDGTGTLTYTPDNSVFGNFDATAIDASTFSYEYTNTNPTQLFRDQFAVSVVASVPEPTSAVVLLAGGITLLTRRKRN